MSSIISIDLVSDSLLNAGVAVTVAIFVNVVTSFLRSKINKRQPTYSERLGKLAEELTRSSKQVDKILGEIGVVTSERQSAAEKLERELERLTVSEAEMKKRVDALKDIPIPVAEHFAKLMDIGEKRNARRDYMLFGAGVLTSIVSAIALKWFGLA
jgi:hypothetical protein